MMNTEPYRGEKGINSSSPLHMEQSLTKRVLALVIIGIAASLSAETLTFPEFSIDVATDWKHSVEERTFVSDVRGELISIFRPDGVGVLRIQSYVAPDDVSKVVLRNLTNVEASTRLTWQKWGDFSGYQYSYTESSSFYKQWWLTNDRTILFITYECDADAQEIEIESIDDMVNSIQVNRS